MKIDLNNISKKQISNLKNGDIITISGIIYTSRDATCKKIFNTKKPLFNLKDKVIYFCGPSPTPPKKIIGSCGPTTTSRMQEYFEEFLKQGVVGFIGKGEIDKKLLTLFKKYEAILLNATGGIGALLASKVKSAKIVALKELGAEAIWQLEVDDFPVIVAVDSKGKSIFA